MPETKKEVVARLQPVADALGTAVTGIWGIFIKRYVAKGLSEILLAVFVSGLGLSTLHGLWIWIPLSVAALLCFDAINLIVNPAYFDLGDITEKLKDGKESIGVR